MRVDRRALLSVSIGTVAASAFSLSACASGSGRASSTRSRAALIVPSTGAHASLGRSMEQAARLAQQAATVQGSLSVFDESAGAAAAAARAVAAGAPLLLGPVFGANVAEVVAAARGRPVIAFTNDGGAVGSGAYVLGVTPSQSVSAVLRFARRQGVRRAVIVAGSERWDVQALDAARSLGATLDLHVEGLPADRFRAAGSAAAELVAAANGGAAPDAVLLAGVDPDALSAVRALAASGVQLLLSSLWDDAQEPRSTLLGAWIATPDPERVQRFASAYATSFRTRPGTLAALAFDAAGIATALQAAARANAAGLIEPAGFSAVTGPLRFEASGRCVREMTVSVVEAERLRPVERIAAA